MSGFWERQAVFAAPVPLLDFAASFGGEEDVCLS